VFSDRTAINNPPQPAAAAGTSIERNLFGDIVGGTRIEYVPSAAGGLGDFRRIYKDANGQDAYLELKPNERTGEYSDSNRDAWRARHTTNKVTADARAEAAKQQGIVSQEREKDRAIRKKEVDATITSIKQQGENQLGQLRLQGEALNNQYQVSLRTLAESTEARKDNAAARATEAELTRQQMALNNNLQQQKLLQDSAQFERQVALDEKNGRRTQVLGALTLIAQSAAKF
jgi:hypothetical protein